MYNYKNIEDVRKDVIGLKIVDFEQGGKAIYLEDDEGRAYTMDTSSNEGVFVHKGNTPEEMAEDRDILFDLLLEKLDIDIADLWKLYK